MPMQPIRSSDRAALGQRPPRRSGAPPAALEMTPEQFARLSALIYRKLGLMFEGNKAYFLNKRVESRVAERGLSGFDDYLFQLSYGDPDGEEMQALANLVTTNETYMFREFEQFAAFANCCLPEVVAAREKTSQRRLRIWCAGCSSGEEAYTLAIIIREVLPDSRRWDIEITATDIDENMIEQARAGIYGDRSVRGVPREYARYIVPGARGFSIHPDAKQLVRVQHLNLHDDRHMGAMRAYDFVFCRNVLIYFDDDSRRKVLDHFYQAMNPGGYIFLGHSQSVGRITPAFRLKRAEGHMLYVKD